MDGSFRRNRMVSVRLSPAEYARLQSLCAAKGIRSISDLARTAMQSLIDSPEERPRTNELVDLRKQMRTLAMEIERLSRVLETRAPDRDSA